MAESLNRSLVSQNSGLTRVHWYGILYPPLYWAASSMAEHPTLNRQVQGSSPWQPTSTKFP